MLPVNNPDNRCHLMSLAGYCSARSLGVEGPDAKSLDLIYLALVPVASNRKEGVCE